MSAFSHLLLVLLCFSLVNISTVPRTDEYGCDGGVYEYIQQRVPVSKMPPWVGSGGWDRMYVRAGLGE